MSVLKAKLIKDKFLWLESMGMYFDLEIVKRLPNEDEQGLNKRIETIADALKDNPESKEKAWKPTLFLNGTQFSKLPVEWQNIIAPKAYMMYAPASFSGVQLPAAGPWNPVEFIWKSNYNVLVEAYKDSPERTAEWLGYRFRVASPAEVSKYPAPEGSLASPDEAPVTPPPSGGGGTTPPTTGGGGSVTIPTEITVNVHIWNHSVPGDTVG